MTPAFIKATVPFPILGEPCTTKFMSSLEDSYDANQKCQGMRRGYFFTPIYDISYPCVFPRKGGVDKIFYSCYYNRRYKYN